MRLLRPPPVSAQFRGLRHGLRPLLVPEVLVAHKAEAFGADHQERGGLKMGVLLRALVP